jgi:hypothetical protein
MRYSHCQVVEMVGGVLVSVLQSGAEQCRHLDKIIRVKITRSSALDQMSKPFD